MNQTQAINDSILPPNNVPDYAQSAMNENYGNSHTEIKLDQSSPITMETPNNNQSSSDNARGNGDDEDEKKNNDNPWNESENKEESIEHKEEQ